MIDFLQYLAAFVLILAPLVVIHEFGHFIVAKWFGIGVPVFSVGFGPRLFGMRRGGTDYRISAVPLGGYVRLAGDEADENRSGAPEEFLSRPKYQRFFVFVAGAAFNVLLAIAAMWLYFGILGKQDPVDYMVAVLVEPDSPAAAAGAEPGDLWISVEGRDLLEDRRAYLEEILLSPGATRDVVVERDGRRIPLELTLGTGEDGEGYAGAALAGSDSTVITQVNADSPAEKAGIQPGDRVLGAGGENPVGYSRFMELLQESPGRPVRLVLERDERIVQTAVTPDPDSATIGVGLVPAAPKTIHVELGPVAALGESLRYNVDQSMLLFTVLKRLVTAQMGLNALSGPIGIAQVSRDAVSAGWESVLRLLAFISLQLGILNLLPIPVLDGGHILILLVEGVMRRDLSERIKERVMQVGFLFLVALMSTVIVLDIFKIT